MALDVFKNRVHFLRRDVFQNNQFESFFSKTIRKNVLGFEHVNKYDDSKYLIASGMGYLLLDMDRENIQPKIAIDNINKDNLQNISSIPLLAILS